MTTVEALDEDIRRRNSRALVMAFSVGLLFNVLLLFVLGGISLSFGLAIGVYTYLRLSQGRKIIVWLRRFNMESERNARFPWLLQGAVRNIGVAITLQDSTFRYAYMRSPAAFFFTILILLKFALLGSLLAAILIAYKLGSNSSVLVAAIACLIFALLLRPLLAFLRHNGFTRISKTKWQRNLKTRLQAIVNRKAVRSSVEIFRCDNSFWREAVDMALRSASAAVIDVSNVTENLCWELEKTLHYLPPGSVILACRPADGNRAAKPGTAETLSPEVMDWLQGRSSTIASPETGEIPAEARVQLQEKVTAADLTRCRVFQYDPALPSIGPGRNRYLKAKSSELRTILIQAIAESALPFAHTKPAGVV